MTQSKKSEMVHMRGEIKEARFKEMWLLIFGISSICIGAGIFVPAVVYCLPPDLDCFLLSIPIIVPGVLIALVGGPFFIFKSRKYTRRRQEYVATSYKAFGYDVSKE